jgi:hypothetical protein
VAEFFKKRKKMIKSEPGFPVFREAVSAIHRPALCWLEGDFALFSTVCADSLCHFSGTEVFRTTKILSLHCIRPSAVKILILIILYIDIYRGRNEHEHTAK